MRVRLSLGALILLTAVALVPLVIPTADDPLNADYPQTSDELAQARLKETPPGLVRKLAAMATFSPGAATLFQEVAGGSGMQDWLEHSTPGPDIGTPGWCTAASTPTSMKPAWLIDEKASMRFTSDWTTANDDPTIRVSTASTHTTGWVSSAQ